MAALDVGDRTLAALDAVEEIAHVQVELFVADPGSFTASIHGSGFTFVARSDRRPDAP